MSYLDEQYTNVADSIGGGFPILEETRAKATRSIADRVVLNDAVKTLREEDSLIIASKVFRVGEGESLRTWGHERSIQQHLPNVGDYYEKYRVGRMRVSDGRVILGRSHEGFRESSVMCLGAFFGNRGIPCANWSPTAWFTKTPRTKPNNF